MGSPGFARRGSVTLQLPVHPDCPPAGLVWDRQRHRPIIEEGRQYSEAKGFVRCHEADLTSSRLGPVDASPSCITAAHRVPAAQRLQNLTRHSARSEQHGTEAFHSTDQTPNQGSRKGTAPPSITSQDLPDAWLDTDPARWLSPLRVPHKSLHGGSSRPCSSCPHLQ